MSAKRCTDILLTLIFKFKFSDDNPRRLFHLNKNINEISKNCSPKAVHISYLQVGYNLFDHRGWWSNQKKIINLIFISTFQCERNRSILSLMMKVSKLSRKLTHSEPASSDSQVLDNPHVHFIVFSCQRVRTRSHLHRRSCLLPMIEHRGCPI